MLLLALLLCWRPCWCCRLDFSVVPTVETASAVASDLVDAGACCCWRLCYLWCPFHSRRPTTPIGVPTSCWLPCCYLTSLQFLASLHVWRVWWCWCLAFAYAPAVADVPTQDYPCHGWSPAVVSVLAFAVPGNLHAVSFLAIAHKLWKRFSNWQRAFKLAYYHIICVLVKGD